MVKNRYHTDVERGQIVALHKMDCLNAKFLSNLVSTGHLFSGQSKNLPQMGFLAIEKKVVGHGKQLHEMTLP